MKQKSHRHYFHDLEIFHGEEIICLTGVGVFVIDDESNGEYLDQEQKIANFQSVTISDYKWLDERIKPTLTKQDIKCLEAIMLEKFNQDFELCESLAWDIHIDGEDE